jgi:hypothetical protein
MPKENALEGHKIKAASTAVKPECRDLHQAGLPIRASCATSAEKYNLATKSERSRSVGRATRTNHRQSRPLATRLLGGAITLGSFLRSERHCLF